ncbi:MAG: GspE/PulE family protein [Planctomycetota bacterium]
MPRIDIPEVAKAIEKALAEPDQPMTRAADAILGRAADLHASDVHVTPAIAGGKVRFRIDGFFSDAADLPADVMDQLVARFKVMAGLIVHKHDLAQEGRIVVRRDAGDIFCRLSVVPTVNGERAVLRLFDQLHDLMGVDELGFAEDVVKEYREAVFGLDGVIALTGPSGSGKTTTLYATLDEIDRTRGDSLSIITIEDPVEYNLGRFAQMEVNPRAGLDFSGALSAALRQDPEVIMVGEIRDVETCRIALRAGLTGHLVLTTVHAGTAPAVITRLLDLEVEPSVVASSLRAVLAQRLVRRVCPRCAETGPVGSAAAALCAGAGVEPPERAPVARGCPACMGIGYKGRTAICEFLRIDDEMGSLIHSRPGTAAVEKKARAKGVRSLAAHGLQKVRDGLTTIEEVMRVTLAGGSVLP